MMSKVKTADFACKKQKKNWKELLIKKKGWGRKEKGYERKTVGMERDKTEIDGKVRGERERKGMKKKRMGEERMEKERKERQGMGK